MRILKVFHCFHPYEHSHSSVVSANDQRSHQNIKKKTSFRPLLRRKTCCEDEIGNSIYYEKHLLANANRLG